MPTVSELLGDLTAEHAALDTVVADLAAEAWLVPTPAEGWNVRDSVSHLCFFDENATLAITDPAAFETKKAGFIAEMAGGDRSDVALGRDSQNPGDILDRWRVARHGYLDAAAAAEAAAAAAGTTPPRVPWYGPPMGFASFTTARIMETWAHGQDIRDALNAPAEVGPPAAPRDPPRSGRPRLFLRRARCRRSRRPGHRAGRLPGRRDLDMGAGRSCIPIGSPDRPWTWPWSSPNAVTRLAPAWLSTGPVARRWIDVAQAFAGPPSTTAEDR